jgi:hypothetical protein
MDNENFFTDIPLVILPVLTRKLPNGKFVEAKEENCKRVFCRLPNSNLQNKNDLISQKNIWNIIKNSNLKEY